MNILSTEAIDITKGKEEMGSKEQRRKEEERNRGKVRDIETDLEISFGQYIHFSGHALHNR